MISVHKVIFPKYENVRGIEFYYPKKLYDNATQNPKLKIEKIFYVSDGLKVAAYIARPIQLNNKKYPLIIFNRGSYIRNDIAYTHAPLFQKFVDNGFIVLAPALRESEGSEGKDQVGGNDLADIMNTLPLLNSLAYVDTSSLFMYGESRGGMMTFQAIRDKYPIKAAATVGAFTDLEMFNKANAGMEEVSAQIWPDFKINKAQIYERRSALKWAEQLNIPLLIMNGGSDQQVNPKHSLLLAEKLQQLNKPYQLIILESGNHILSGELTNERDHHIIQWFKKHLSPKRK